MSVRLLTRILGLTAGLAVVAGAAQATISEASDSSGVYVVQPGDSLWRIATDDGITVSQLAAANGLSANGLLLIGTRLTIPTSSNASAAGTSVAATSVAGSSSSDGDGDGDDSNSTAATASSTTASSTTASSTTASSTTASSTTSTSASGGAAYVPGSFCPTFTPQGGPVGVLPQLLTDYPGRLALRPLFVEWAAHYGVSAALVEAIAWQESGWQQDVVSSAQAVGVGQLIPSTASFVQNDLVGQSLDITSTSDNIRMSAAFLAYLSRVEGGNLCLTIAAYYEGPLNLGRYGVFTMTEPYVESVEALLPRFQ